MERAGLVVGRSTRTRISEEFRIAVGRIARASAGSEIAPATRPGRVDGASTPRTTAASVIMVTSAKPGEGKTFTALNLAAVLAQHGPRRVLLVDIDYKQHSISELLGIGERSGVYDILGPQRPTVRSLAVTTEVIGLSVLPVGTLAKTEGVDNFSTPLVPRLEQIAAAFPHHLIVIDAPPCLSTSDPSTVAGMVGQVVMVVEANKTQRAELEAALDFVRASPLITVLLNKTQQSSRRTFGSYDYLSSYQ